MEQQRIGAFIAACRKEKGMTQAVLAERLGITDRAVSKWETGRSMPDVSLMPELCRLLEISFNELLSGERLDMENYQAMAEEHLMRLHKQEETSAKKLLSLETAIGVISTAALLLLVLAAGFATELLWWRIALLAGGLAIFAAGVTICIILEHDAGYYACPHCGTRYVPTMRAVVFAPHMGRSRSMTCPHCGKRGYHKKVLRREEDAQ